MQQTKKITIERNVVDKITCNKCGEVFIVSEWDSFDPLIHNFKVEYGYGSDFDMMLEEFDLCEKCIKEFTGQFKIKSKETSNGFF